MLKNFANQKTNKKKQKAIIYNRGTKSDFNLRNIDKQQKECEEFLDKLGIIIHSFFHEDKIGSPLHRPIFSEMLECIKNNNIKFVVVSKIKQILSKKSDKKELITIINKFKKHNAYLLNVKKTTDIPPTRKNPNSDKTIKAAIVDKRYVKRNFWEFIIDS